MKHNPYRIILYCLLPLLGTLFLLWYIKNATCDVVYSDYIRLVNSYLPDVYNPRKFFVPDVLTRLPINYLCRIVNMELFGFSVTFERVLGAVSLGLAALVFAAYCLRRGIGPSWFALVTAVMFSLNKWEMLTNGSGWSHFFAFACFYYHELVLDRVWAGEEKRHDHLRLCFLPWFIILGTAGPYCASYAVVIMLFCVFCAISEKGDTRRLGSMGALRFRGDTRRLGSLVALRFRGRACSRPVRDMRYVVYMLCTLAPLLLYILSNSFAVEEHAGATGRSLAVILRENPTFSIRFLLKSFAGMLVGGEELTTFVEAGVMSNRWCYVLGLMILSGYLLALWLNFRFRLYEETIFPLMLLVGGGGNHLLIFLSRYIFEQENYALSSRYALQFQVGILGIVLTAALVWKKCRRKGAAHISIALICLAILVGNGYTTYREICKAPYREERYEQMARTAPELPGLSDAELEARGAELEGLYEYKKGTDKIRRAFQILEENGLNVFRQ